jgi:cytochrome c oxidase subunit II
MFSQLATTAARVSTTLARAGVLAVSLIAPAMAAKDLNMPVGVTELSAKIYELHMLIFWVCVAIALVVFAAMIYSIMAFRKSRGAIADTKLTHSTKVEIVWSLVPLIILVLMAVPAARTLLDIEDTRGTELSIKVTGYQWKWHYDYLDRGVSFFSTLARSSNAARQLGSGIDPNTVPNYLLDVDNPLVVSAGTKVRLLLTSNDVIHAWWVPDFGMKKDAIPGFVNELWFRVDEDRIGTYRGQCAELCGRDHGYMPIVVEVKNTADFEAWLRAKQDEARQAAAPAANPAAATVQLPAPAEPASASTLARTN